MEVSNRILCDLCHKSFTNSYVLATHKRTVHNSNKNDKFECEICYNRFSTKYKLMRHIQGKSIMNIFFVVSKLKFFSHGFLTLVGVHSNIRQFNCNHCGKSFKTRDVMLKHQRVHEPNTGPFTCTVCDHQFKFKTGLDYHLKRVHQKEKKKGKIESTESQITLEKLNDKIKDIEPPNESNIPNDELEMCKNYEFIVEVVEKQEESEDEDPIQEENVNETFEEIFISPLPSSDFFSELDDNQLLKQIDKNYVLVEKITLLMDEEQKVDSEESCIDKYIISHGLDTEQDDGDIFEQLIEKDEDLDNVSMTCFDDEEDIIATNQTKIDLKSLTCETCGSSFKSKSNLNRHVQRKHDKSSYKIKCEICDKKFLLDFDLKRHLMSHNSTKNFSCNKCRKKFKTIRSLEQHRTLLHSDTPRSEKSFQCFYCDRMYFHKRHLGYHMRKHTGENNYHCDKCDLNFHYKEKFMWHKVRVHDESAPFFCQKCKKKFLHQKAYEDHNEDKCHEVIVIDNQKKITK